MSGRLKRVHMIGNAHIDPVWLWQWPEGYQEVRATFQSAVDRLNEYPEFVFTCDSSLFFAWVEESDPPLFEQRPPTEHCPTIGAGLDVGNHDRRTLSNHA